MMVLVLLAVILGLKLYSWNVRSLVGNSMPMPFGYGVSVVLSGSMEPYLSVNDLVLIRETDDVKVGDVVVYESEGNLIIHRIIEKNGDEIVTQGDANSVADAPFDISSLKGKMIAHIQAAGAVVRVIKTPFGTVVLLAAAILLIEFSYHKEREENDKELEEIREEIRRLQRAKTDEPV
jgi:signal peptidase